MGNVRLSLPEELHQALKHESIDQRIALKDLIVKALQEYIDRCKREKV